MYLVLFSFTIRPNFSVFQRYLSLFDWLAVINVSSAYAEHCFKRVDMLPLNSSCFKISPMNILNRVADSGSPCFTPVDISNFSV
jgi:hypothetical protein